MDNHTYGALQETAAAKLAQLIGNDRLPTTAADVDQLLRCRDGVVDALQQRLRLLGLTINRDGHSDRTRWLRLTDLPEQLPGLIGQITHELPTLPAERRGSPLEALGTPNDDPIVEGWRIAATALLAGSHALETARDQSWIDDPAARWWVTRDLATTLEAVLVLDHPLAEVGLLAAHDAVPGQIDTDDKRFLTSQCARVAGWQASNDIPDRSRAYLSSEVRPAGPVHLVTTAHDLAPAQRNLARFLRPINLRDPHVSLADTLDAPTIHRVVASQVMLHNAIGHIASACYTREIGATGVLEHLASQHEILAEIRTHMPELIDLGMARTDPRVAWQQSEITTSLSRLRRNGRLLAAGPLDATGLVDLARASHEVTTNLAVSVRRELGRPNSNLRLYAPYDEEPRRIWGGHPLHVSLTDLANAPKPCQKPRQPSIATQRAVLRATLDATPTASAAETAPHVARADRTPMR